jgi:hypothetical protein
VVEQVLTGTYADGLGNVKNVPDRIDFDPFPGNLCGLIMTQMKRWGQIKGDVIALRSRRRFSATNAAKLMKDVADPAHDDVESLCGHGQDIRSGQTRVLRHKIEGCLNEDSIADRARGRRFIRAVVRFLFSLAWLRAVQGRRNI